METLYQDGPVRLWEEDGQLRFCDGAKEFVLTSYPYEPCLYLTDGEGHQIVIHNSFEESWIASIAREGGTLSTLSGNAYDIARVCGLLQMAAREWRSADLDVFERLYQPRGEDGGVPVEKQRPEYCIPLKEGTLRERIVEMMQIAGDGPDRRAGLGRLKKLYASEDVPIRPEGERFLSRYAYLFSTLTPGFGDGDDDLKFHFETFDEFLEEERGARLRAAAGQGGRVAEAAGCPVTPVGLYGFDRPLSVYAGEDGLLYGCKEGSDEVRVYPSVIDLYEDELQGHPPVALDD